MANGLDQSFIDAVLSDPAVMAGIAMGQAEPDTASFGFGETPTINYDYNPVLQNAMSQVASGGVKGLDTSILSFLGLGGNVANFLGLGEGLPRVEVAGPSIYTAMNDP